MTKYTCGSLSLGHFVGSVVRPSLFLRLLCGLIVVTVLFGARAQAQSPVLKLRYAFDDQGPGTTTPSDLSGGGVDAPMLMLNKSGAVTNLHGTANSGVAALSNPNAALNLSSNTTQGASGNYVVTTNANFAFGNVTNFAVTMWMKQSVVLPGVIGGRMFLLGNNTASSDAGTTGTIGMKWQDSNSLYFYVNNNQTAASFTSLPTNSWIFVAMVYDGAHVMLYEGTEASAATLINTNTTTQTVALTNSTASLFLGNRPQRDRAFAGWIDDFRFYTGSGDSNFVESIRQAAAGPSGLKAVPNNNQVALSWNASPGAISYNVKRGTASGSYSSLSAPGTVTGNSYTDVTAVNGTSYYYIVSAVTANGETANSPEVSAAPNVPPLAPEGLTATTSNLSVALTWSAATGAARYNVKRSITQGAEVTITNLAVTNYTDTAVNNGSTYYYVVSAINSSGAESINSAEVIATPVGPPAAPSGLVTSGVGIGQVGLSWNATFLSTGYNVYRSTATNGIYVFLGATSVTNYLDAAAVGSGFYYYEVSAVNAQGEGPKGSPVPGMPLTPRLRFDFSDAGATTADSVMGLSLSIVNSNNLSTDYHGAVGSGVAGVGKSLDFTVNPSHSPAHGPLAMTVTNSLLNSNHLGAISNFTLSLWVKPDRDFYDTNGIAIATNNNPRLVLFSPGNVTNYPSVPTSAYPGLLMKINSYDQQAQTGELKVALNGAEYVTPSGSFVSSTSVWSFIAVTYDGSNLKIYNATQTNAASVVLSATNVNQVLNFTTNGNLMLGNELNLTKSLDGRMADLRFYSGAGNARFVENVRLLAANPPSGVTAIAGVGQVGLTWNAFGGASSYNVKRSLTSGGPYTTVSNDGNVTGTAFADQTALEGTTYYYVLSVTTVFGESANSAEVSSANNVTPTPVAGNDGPLFAGATLHLSASTIPGATYSWTGPGGFISLLQNPVIENVATNASGIYYVTATVGASTSLAGSTTVVVTPVPLVALSIQTSGDVLKFNWSSGTLQSCTNLPGVWTDVEGATAPSFTVIPSGSQQFFRVKVQ